MYFERNADVLVLTRDGWMRERFHSKRSCVYSTIGGQIDQEGYFTNQWSSEEIKAYDRREIVIGRRGTDILCTVNQDRRQEIGAPEDREEGYKYNGKRRSSHPRRNGSLDRRI